MSQRIIQPFVLTVVVLSLTIHCSFGQQQIKNSGFEDWEEIRSDVMEPAGWNSIKNTDSDFKSRMAPQVCFQGEKFHSGKSSLKLVNKSALGIVANGMLTTGAIHGEKNKTKSFVYTDVNKPGFYSMFTSRPDSVTGWYQYKPSGNDSAMVVVLLHDGYVTLPDKGTRSRWIGGVKIMLGATSENSWKRFSAPIIYFKKGNPKYILAVFSSGNRMNAVEGSVAYFDDIQLIYNKQ